MKMYRHYTPITGLHICTMLTMFLMGAMIYRNSGKVFENDDDVKRSDEEGFATREEYGDEGEFTTNEILEDFLKELRQQCADGKCDLSDEIQNRAEYVHGYGKFMQKQEPQIIPQEADELQMEQTQCGESIVPKWLEFYLQYRMYKLRELAMVTMACMTIYLVYQMKREDSEEEILEHYRMRYMRQFRNKLLNK